MRTLFGSALAACALLFFAPLASAVESLVVTTTVDEDNGTSDPNTGAGTSLREAINYANADGVSSAITFRASSFAAPRKTIVLNATLPTVVVNGSLSIAAPAAGVEISGNDTSRIFYIDHATVTMTGLTLRNGKASGDFGGALYNSGGLLVMDSCTLTANYADFGGAIATNGFFVGGFPPNTVLRNCTLSGNRAGGHGGAVYTLNGPIQIDSCTITQNEADVFVNHFHKGGGVFSDPQNGNTMVRNSIIAANTAGSSSNDVASGAAFQSQGYNLIGSGDSTGSFGAIGDQLIGSGDPGVGSLAENGGRTKTCALSSNSPARDAGNSDFSVDQRGVSRPQGVVDDKGAFEFNTNTKSESLVVTTTADEDDGTSDPGFGTGTALREAIKFANVYGGNNTITFSASAFGAPRKTIVLNGTLPTPVLNGSLSITAPAAGVEISGNNQSRIFIVMEGANVTLNGLTMRNGKAPPSSSGGAIVALGTLLVDQCTLTANSADTAGAIASYTDLSGATVTLRNSTLSGNSAQGAGAAIYNQRGLTVIDSCTIVGNTAQGGGGGIASWGDSGTTRTEVRNSIVSGNSTTDVTVPNGVNSFKSNGYNLIGNGNFVTAFNQTGDVTGNTNPGVQPLADNAGRTQTRALLLTSPARDTGNTTLLVDQRGVTRPQSGADDKGAFELALDESLVVTTTADEDDGTSDPGYGTGTSLREAINRANSDGMNSAITFGPSVFTAPRKIITLSASLPTLQADFSSITAPPAGVEISGNNTVPIFTNAAIATITGVTFRNGNNNSYRGGAIQNVDTLTLDRCAFINNSASVGGAISTQTPLTVRNCTFVGNTASNGGAIYGFSGASTLIESSTITGNTAPAGRGSGVASVGDSNTLTEVQNSIIAGNTNGDVDLVFGSTNSFQSDGHNLIGDGNANAKFNQTGDLLIGNGKPGLAPLADNGGPAQTMALQATSPAIDRGNSGVAVDGRGVSRPIDFTTVANAAGGNGSDIGAYELATQPAAILSARSLQTHGPSPFGINLPLTGGGVEDRLGANGSFQVIFTFGYPLSTVGNVRVTSGTGTPVGSASGIDQQDARNYIATLSGVPNAQTITVTLDNVQDTAGGSSSAVSVDMGVLLGDVNGDGSVNSGDATLTRSASGQIATGTNFRADVNRDGTINSGDATIVRGRSGQSLP